MSKERLDSGWSHAPESASVHVPIDIFLVIKAVAVIAVRVWSRQPGWCDRQILALTAGAPLRLRLVRRYLHARIRLRASDRRARITKVGIRGLGGGSSLEGRR